MLGSLCLEYMLRQKAIGQFGMQIWPLRQALVFGSERDGIPAEALRLLTASAIVPMEVSGDEGSLNLSHAVTVAAYERRRQLARRRQQHLTGLGERFACMRPIRRGSSEEPGKQLSTASVAIRHCNLEADRNETAVDLNSIDFGRTDSNVRGYSPNFRRSKKFRR